MVWLDKALNSSSVCGIICWIDIESGYVLNVSGVASINILEGQCKQAEPGSHVSWVTTQDRILLKWLLRSRVRTSSLSRILSYLKRLLGKVFYLNGGSFCHYPPCPKPKKCSAIHYRAYITVFRPNETVTMSFERDLVFYEMRWCRLHFWYFCAFKVNNYIHKSKLHYYVLICLLPPNTIYCRCVLNLVSNEHNYSEIFIKSYD